MSRLTLRLPNTLHEQIREQAEYENISINQYVVYALTRQISQAYQVTKPHLIITRTVTFSGTLSADPPVTIFL